MPRYSIIASGALGFRVGVPAALPCDLHFLSTAMTDLVPNQAANQQHNKALPVTAQLHNT